MAVTPKPLGKSKKKPSGDVSGTVDRTLRLLQFVADTGQFSLKQCVEAVQLPTSTVHRMLQILTRRDFIERNGQQTYSVSREFFRMGSLAAQKFDLNNTARPHLEAIFAQFQESCSFALFLPGLHSGMIVDAINTPFPLKYLLEPFKPWPLAWGSLGRSMLAHLPEEEVAAILAAAPPSPGTGLPPPTPASLAAELAGIRALGHYVSVNQNVLGATGTASAVLGMDGEVIGSIGMTVPLARYDPGNQPAMSETITRHARELSAALGFRRSRAA